ncbi:2-phosphosulfolactate phosphatase [Eisenibacter elegans]|jgi:2-phosphosulfolactate phosphatase|uniref:2-phosphosulfolactate phosphatase n=1 Tax=Eisenibacter elegans TaxID=997 RepID=UPI000423E18B|nr:2-phosphosulfolactate phosphatase [Eisenibacter elegans]
MRTLDVCLTPDLLPLYPLGGKIAVVIDVLRATSCMVTAFAHGVAAIIPVKELEVCRDWQAKGFLAAAERGGQKVEGFDLDNSPFSYMQASLQGQTVVMTTTNGTRAIEDAHEAEALIIGAFLNKQAVIDYLYQATQSVVLICAGWKGRVNMEDMLFAGAVAEALHSSHQLADDSSILSRSAYQQAKPQLKQALEGCGHFDRLKGFGAEKDVDFCLQENHYAHILPIRQGDRLVRHQ